MYNFARITPIEVSIRTMVSFSIFLDLFLHPLAVEMKHNNANNLIILLIFIFFVLNLLSLENEKNSDVFANLIKVSKYHLVDFVFF